MWGLGLALGLDRLPSRVEKGLGVGLGPADLEGVEGVLRGHDVAVHVLHVLDGLVQLLQRRRDTGWGGAGVRVRVGVDLGSG